MDFNIKKIPEKSKIIVGFPGVGLVGTITTEFLINHLEAKEIGSFDLRSSPLIAIHKGNLLKPVVVYHAKKQNIVIIHSIAPVQGLEWDLADAICKFVKKSKGQLITLDGIATQKEKTRVLSIGFEKIQKLEEGIILGIIAALITKVPKTKSIFCEVHSDLPDSRAAAELIKVLDKLFNLKIDPKPLLKQAELFENKLKGIMEQNQDAKQSLRYIG